MQTRPAGEKQGHDDDEPERTTGDARMGLAYAGVIVVEVLVLVGLWAAGAYFSSL